MGGVRRILTGIGRALRARPRLFVGVAAAVLVLDVLVPVAVLSIARVPVDYFTVQPLAREPAGLPGLRQGHARGASGPGLGAGALLVLGRRRLRHRLGLRGDHRRSRPLHRDGRAGRRLLRALGASARRRRRRRAGACARVGRAACSAPLGSVCGLATGGCTVMGCGAPVIPVVGLAFVGLSSTTLTLFAQVSTYATIAVVDGTGRRRAVPRVARRRPPSSGEERAGVRGPEP